MGNQERKLRRKKQEKQKKEDKKVFRCPVCNSDGFLRPHPELGVQIGETALPMLVFYEALQVVKCGSCGVLYDPYAKEAREQAIDMAEIAEKAAEAEEEAKERAESVMSREDFGALREKYADVIKK